MKKLLSLVILLTFISGCGPTLYDTNTAEEFESIARSQGYNFTSRAQPISWITADGLVETGNYKPAGGAGYTQQQANQIALDLCNQYTNEGRCIITKESGRITHEATSVITRLKKEQKTKKVEKPKKKKLESDDNKVVPASMGSGFFVTRTGHLVTNYHVIEGCDAVKTNTLGKEIRADVVAIDKTNDLAILKAKINPTKVFPVSNKDVSLLQNVIVAGFPLGKQVSSSIKIHKGNVTALAGFGDNYSNFQTDATINQGNSGGPIMNQKGNIVGVAVQLIAAEHAQNVFFGVKSSTLRTFAQANNIKFLTPNYRDMSNEDLGEFITEATVFLECWMTVAKIKQIIAQEENRRAFYSEHKS